MDRPQLNALLKQTLGSNFVYFQPPADLGMEYPCIVYERSAGDVQFAGNRPYRFNERYQVTFISKKPDSAVLDKLAHLPMCLFDRTFVANNLYHSVFTIYI